jgi:hypothetical protein
MVQLTSSVESKALTESTIQLLHSNPKKTVFFEDRESNCSS